MARRRLDPRRAKIHFNYSVSDIVRLYGVHKNTVRAWLKEGLPRIDDSRPILVHGRDLRAFLERRRQARRRSCPPGTCYCLKCREPRPPALGMVDFVGPTAGSINLRAICATCGTLMHRRVRHSRIATVMPNLAVQFTEADSHIRERARPSVDCDSGKERETGHEAQL